MGVTALTGNFISNFKTLLHATLREAGALYWVVAPAKCMNLRCSPYLTCVAGVVKVEGSWASWLIGAGALSAVMWVAYPRIAQWYMGTSTPPPVAKLPDWHALPLRPNGGPFQWSLYVQNTENYIPPLREASPVVREYLRPLQVITDHYAAATRHTIGTLDHAHFFPGHQRKIQSELISRTLGKCEESFRCKWYMGHTFDVVAPLGDHAVGQLPRMPYAGNLFDTWTILPGYNVSADVAAHILDYSAIFGF